MTKDKNTPRVSGPDQGYAEALQRIEAARKTRATKLDLSGLNLTALPKELGELKALTELFLHDNPVA
jgi:Leucine-rich repeat (LRR) protein